jgi:acetyl esterase/lipase
VADRRNRTLLRGLAELANAANGVHPLGRRGYLTIPIFLLGWPTTELTPLLLTGSALDVLRRGIRGDFMGRRGRIALVSHVITWALLVLLIRRNVKSEPYFDAGLREELGPAYRAVAATSQPALKATREHGGVFATGWSRRRYVEKSATIRYGPHRHANLADIWRRADLPLDAKAPVLLQVPGGVWTIGMRRPQAYPLLSHLAERGWVCVSIGYRVSPRHSWPAHIVDVKRALAWVKENIADYGGDPDFVAITGGSAGGHLCALAALTPGDPQFQPGFEDADTSVAAAVPVYGRYDWLSTEGAGRTELIEMLERIVTKAKFIEHPQVYLDASPIAKVRADAPPFFVLHGTDDSIIPVPEARDFVTKLRGVSADVVAYSEIPHAQHAFDFFGSPRGHYTAEAIERFLSWVQARKAI